MCRINLKAQVLFKIRVCTMLMFVFGCFIGPSYSAGGAVEHATDAESPSCATFFLPFGDLTEKQRKSTVTIEFNVTVIDTKNRTAMIVIYKNVRNAILEYLNRKESKSASSAVTTALVPTASAVSTTPTFSPTPITTTIVIASTIERREVQPQKRKKRKRREEILEDDIKYVEVVPEIDRNAILRISLLLHREGFDYFDLGIMLFEAANHTHNAGALNRLVGAPVVKIYMGLPANRGSKTSHHFSGNFHVWPVLLVIVILLIITIGIFIYFWKTGRIRRFRPVSSS